MFRAAELATRHNSSKYIIYLLSILQAPKQIVQSPVLQLRKIIEIVVNRALKKYLNYCRAMVTDRV